MRMRGVAALLVAGGILGPAGILGPSAVAYGAQSAETALYRCADGATVEVPVLGIDLCDAAPTPRLAERAEPDNLQTRDGALVVEVDDAGIAAIAGVQPGDMIYRVAGVDVPGADDAGAGLATVGTDSDTQINFLRRGRPYRIKLRR